MNLRTLIAVWAGKTVIGLSRRLGKGGSTLPGRVARVIDPLVLERLGRQPRRGTIAVSGTNGKTTTSKMLSDILEAAGERVTHNRAGANLIFGLTAAFLGDTTWGGRVRGSVALMETDEATMPRACRELRPRAALVTNFFRDQLDRYGELEHTVNFVARGLEALAAGGQACLNADDPLCASLGARLPAGTTALFYGIEDTSRGLAKMEQAAEAKHCRNCGAPLRYAVYHYAHLGHWACPECGLTRSRPEVYVDRIEATDSRGSTVHIVTPQGDFTVRLQVPGLYNIYNALGAVAGALALGVPLAAIEAGLKATSTQFGRMEAITMAERELFMALVKNPVGFNEVIRTVRESGEGRYLLIAINDLYADGTDISWLWDVDFESLRQDPIEFVVCAGLRADDMALRLKYAGLPVQRLQVEADLAAALDRALEQTPRGETLYVMPTYTAMLGLREVIARRGAVKQFWEV